MGGNAMQERCDEALDGEEVPRRFRFACPRGTDGVDPDPNLLAAYLEGAATPEEEDAIEKAMLADPSVLKAMRELRELAGEAAPEIPAEAVERIWEALARSLSPPGAASPRRGKVSWIWKLATVAALVLFGAFIGIRMGQVRIAEEVAREGAIRSEMTWEWAYGFREPAWFAEK
jgi:hypothetical protein